MELSIYDVAGRLTAKLLDEPREAGPHSIRWDGRDSADRIAPAGVYFARLRSQEGAAVRKLVLVK